MILFCINWKTETEWVSELVSEWVRESKRERVRERESNQPSLWVWLIDLQQTRAVRAQWAHIHETALPPSHFSPISMLYMNYSSETPRWPVRRRFMLNGGVKGQNQGGSLKVHKQLACSCFLLQNVATM